MTPRLTEHSLGVFLLQLAILIGGGVLPGGHASGQALAEPSLSGLVLLGQEPLAGAQVVLHRVSPESAGELDSIPSGPDGTFRFDLPHVPDPEDRSEVFFASVRHLGILYFGSPVTDPVQLDSTYLIQAYDTLTAPAEGADLTVRVRNLFIELDEGGLRATDLFQISNEGDRTLVPGSEGLTWSYPLPRTAQDFELGQGDLSADQVTFESGQVRVTAPLPPGDRLLVLRYRLAELATTIPMPGATGRAELLIREPAPPLRVTVLEPLAPVELEPGTSYRRFLAEDLSSVTATIVPEDPPAGFPIEWLTVVLTLVLVLVAIVALKRPSAASLQPAAVVGERQQVLLQIAQLDERYDPRGPHEDSYRRERASLLRRLDELDPE